MVEPSKKPLKFPPRRAFALSVKREPMFGWDAPADVQTAKDYLRKAKEKIDIGGFHVEQHIEELRQLGLHPAICVVLIAGAYPVTWKNDQASIKELSQLVAKVYMDAATDPGANATGLPDGEENSDGGWDFAKWKHTKFAPFGEWQWIAESDQFIHDGGLKRWSDKQFERLFGKLTTKNLMTEINRGRIPIKKFVAQVYIPKAPPILKYEGQPPMTYSGQTVFNLWRPSDMEPDFGDHQWFLDHLEKLFPNDRVSQQHTLDYMAQLVQHPEIKIHFSILLQSVDGAGKGALGHILRRIVGGRNCVEPDSTEFVEKYTGWQEGAQLAIVAEVWVNGDKEIMDFLKRMITEDTLRIHKKFGNRFSIPNHLNFFCMTNHKDAVPITKYDRRWMVLSSPFMPKPSDKDYFDQLWSNIKDDSKLAAVMGYLMDHKIAFNPKGHAPMTAAKLDMQERALSDIAADLKGRFDGRFEPFDHDVIRADDIVDFLRAGRPYLKGAHKEARDLLEAVNGRELRQYKHGKDGIPAHRLYAIRDQAKWDAMPPVEVARAYYRHITREPDADRDFG